MRGTKLKEGKVASAFSYWRHDVFILELFLLASLEEGSFEVGGDLSGKFAGGAERCLTLIERLWQRKNNDGL